jgi:hypothetical protein
MGMLSRFSFPLLQNHTARSQEEMVMMQAGPFGKSASHGRKGEANEEYVRISSRGQSSSYGLDFER